MSEPMLISPLLDGYLMGDPISEHNGIRCCPAMNNESGEKFIVKIISLPPSPTQLDAMMLAGVFSDQQSAVNYYEERAKDYIREIEVLQQLSRQEGFIPFRGHQYVSSQEHIGFDVYILNHYMRSLERQFEKKPVTHLDALNMSLDICSALTACRRSGYIFANLKPTNIFITEKGEYKISDLGFVSLRGLRYAALPENCISEYTAPEIEDAYSSVSDTLDVYALGMILYRIFNGGTLPENKNTPLNPPKYADEDLSAIILKACSIDPQERWRDPAQMGQMLVSYIQKNGTFDTPIVPPAPDPEIPEEPEIQEASISDDSAVEPETEDEFIQSAEDTESTNDNDIVTELITEDTDEPSEEIPTTGETDASEIQEDSGIIVPEAEEDSKVSAEDNEQTVLILPEDTEDASTEDNSAEETVETDMTDTDDTIAKEIPSTEEACVETCEESSDVIPTILIEEESDAEAPEEAEAPTEEITPEITETQLMEIVEQHDAFSDEAAEIKAAAVYLELDRAQQVDDTSYDGVSDEVSKILSQADTLVTMNAPAPAVAPEATEIVLEIPSEPETAESNGQENPENEITETPEIELTEEEIDMKSKEVSNKKPRRSHLVRNIIVIGLLLLLLAGGALFYQFIVIQTVDQFDVTGVKDQLIIEVSSEADENLISVSCIDEQGNPVNQDGQSADGMIPIYQGKAQITGLRANTTYVLKLHIAGLHLLEGKTEKIYKTPDETTLLQHTVITGNAPGSAILSFTIGGPNSEKWNLTYSTPGYPEKTTGFSGTSVTLTDLIPNKVYTGVLTPEDDLFITKPMEIEFTASELIQASDLKITGCNANKLTAQWNAPEGTVVENWTVRCYSNKEGSTYDETITTSATSHEFKVPNSLDSYTVEVTAVGQATHQEVTIPANSVTITKLNADASIAGVINLTWESGGAPQNGWTVTYCINGSDIVMTLNSKEKSAVIKPVVPNTEYIITVASADSVYTFCQDASVVTKATDDFTIDINNKKITADDLTVSLFKQPTAAQWDYSTLKGSDFTSKFSVNDKAGLLVYLKKEYEDSAAELNATFVIYNDKGEIISVASKDAVWNTAWTKNNCVFNIPTLPQDAGYYKVALYLNSQLVSEHDFSIA